MTKIRRLKKLDFGMLGFLLLAAAAIGIMVHLNNTTGMAINTAMKTFGERVCPDPRYPVLVLIQQSYGAMNKDRVKCIAKGEVIRASGRVFPATRKGELNIINVPVMEKKRFPDIA